MAVLYYNVPFMNFSTVLYFAARNSKFLNEIKIYFIKYIFSFFLFCAYSKMNR